MLIFYEIDRDQQLTLFNINEIYVNIDVLYTVFERNQICPGFYLLFVYICIAVGDPVIKRERLGTN
jgi:hypothetical protein